MSEPGRAGREGRQGREGREGRPPGPGRGVRVVVGALLVAASVVAMGLLTRYDYRPGTDAAELRMVWRTPVPRVVECREPTEAELEELPIHMRRDEICEGRAVAYRLEVRVDGHVRHRSLETAAGARGDRPVHVFETLALEPGRRRVQVVFERADPAEVQDGGGSVASPDGTVGDAAEPPVRLVLDRRLDLGVGDVVLVTYDRDGGRLVLEEGSDG